METTTWVEALMHSPESTKPLSRRFTTFSQ